MKILIACEFSGMVGAAFQAMGCDTLTCDLLPTERPDVPHYLGDVCDILEDGWDLMVAHPPCTYLAVSGARWWQNRQQEQLDALEFVRKLAESPIPRWCIENPVGKLSTTWRKPDQYIQPWQFGHGETKKTGLWLRDLPKLEPTKVVAGRTPRIHHMKPGPERSKERSRFYLGIANAMAEQWAGRDEPRSPSRGADRAGKS